MSALPDFQAAISIAVDHLIGIKWVEGGRDFRRSGGTDCLGITLHVVRDVLGIPAADPWDEFAERWHTRRFDVRDVLPAGWGEVTPAYRLGDVGVTEGGFGVAVYVGGGWWLSAAPEVGTFRFRESDGLVLAAYRWSGAA